GGARQRHLLVGLLVHEDDLVAGVVEVLHALRLRAHALELLAGAERPLDDGARVERLQPRAHERAALAGLDVLELDDAPGLPVERDVHAVAELVRGDGSHRPQESISGYPAEPGRLFGRRRQATPQLTSVSSLGKEV